MKRVIAILIIAMASASLLASCGGMSDASSQTGSAIRNEMGGGGSSTSYFSYDTAEYDGNYAMPEAMPSASAAPMAPMMEPKPDVAYDDYDVAAAGYAPLQSEGGAAPVTEIAADGGLAEKIIYSVYADIETIDFDRTVEMVYEMLALNGAFIESSYIGGRNYAQSYYGWQTYRNASFSLRVPKDRLNAVTASLGDLGNVTSVRSDAENITSQFFDTQSRLNSFKTQEERLLDMLGKADNVPDMIAIEQRLADVRYSIESLTTTLNNWQNRVDYSTLTLYIVEVESFTEISPVQQRTYWQQIGDGLEARTVGVGRFFMDLFKWVVVNIPVLIVIAVIVVVAVVVIRKKPWQKKDRDS